MAAARLILLIPSFNTGPLLRETVSTALATGLPVLVVIDGSTDGSDQDLEDLTGSDSSPASLEVLRLHPNAGKGNAILQGIRHASKQGFTHALCMDADGQHPANAVPAFAEIVLRHPEAAVFGRPVFDASAPALRVNGRKVSNFWANLETLGWGIDDSLFGMRVYPIAPLLEVFSETPFARRFDFDPEVAVRLAWKGIPIINLPTPVRYLSTEEGGVSQFRYCRDNVLLTWMHTRLFFGFVARLPWLIIRGSNPLLHLSPPHDR
ncbi:glycosyltransferase involved in cell wall biosynthesis [Haloferula luteola]|uniref:Glycosyltransferase involved in cell wall biosynthesis n=1 Tax=Haloferula luteola TaxID=595692 RepID=A0A840V0F4_9BACT|nr:glycosyltransferase family 2 protein [Haloferula luteola]MBB5351847.1 glycosyltransferase involved in cell wall biosynthesis [Haloferula luteola]